MRTHWQGLGDISFVMPTTVKGAKKYIASGYQAVQLLFAP
jgi:hypothetical protein